MIKDYFVIALQNLRHRGIRSWLTILGIFLGIAVVVSLISLGNGLQEAVTGQFSTLSVDILIIQNAATGFGPPGSTVVKKLTEHDFEVIKRASNVESAIKRLIRVASIEFNDVRIFSFVSSIPESADDISLVYNSFNLKAEEGRLIKEGERGKVILGYHFKEDHFDKELRVGNNLLINSKEFEIVGILEETGNIIINGAIFMPEEDLKKIMEIDDEIDIIVAKVRDKDKIIETAGELERKFRRDRNLKEGEEDFSVQTPIQSLEGINTVLEIVNLVVIGIAAVSLLVGGIGIMNIMYTSVLERTREIGIMKAVGAKNKDVLMIFLIESGLLGLAGGIIGAVIGLGLAFGASFAVGKFLGGITLDVDVSYPLVIGAISFSFFVGIISGVLPALQASKLHPVEALRK